MAYRAYGRREQFKCRCGAEYEIEHRRFAGSNKKDGRAACEDCKMTMAQWRSTLDRVYRKKQTP